MMTELINAIVPVLITAITGILSYVLVAVKNKVVQKFDTETKKQLLETTVKYIEQVYKDVHGQEKLEIAISKASELFKEKGINIGQTELEMMIEEVVNNLNREVK